MLHSKYVCPLSLLLTTLNLPPLPQSLSSMIYPSLPKYNSLLGTRDRAGHPVKSQLLMVPRVGNLPSSALTFSPLIPAGLATCLGSQGKDPEFQCSGLGQACWGTRDKGQALGAGANLQFPSIPQGRI